MRPQSHQFEARAARALGDETLQAALAKLQREFQVDRDDMRARLPEFDALRDEARSIRDHVLAHLDTYLETFEQNVIRAGGKVHWCRDGAEARAAVLAICREAGATMVAKGKSMISEEIALNDHLAQAGITPVETDLGEYIVQLRDEPPSHIVMPAIHLDMAGVADAFRDGHLDLDPQRPLDTPDALLHEARERLRRTFLTADVGITGANMLVAETGAVVIVTNEGNGDLVHTLPKVHIVLASIEKIVPTPEDAFTILRVLARSATTQEFTSYVAFVAGPRRAGEPDGPAAFHVVLLDGGRAALLATPFRDILRCIRCGACQSLCPVYGAVGGHAYGWVYGGPVGAVLTPALLGIEEARHLPEASTFCGRCDAVCPVGIPLTTLMRRWREVALKRRIVPAKQRVLLALWGWLARRPGLYHAVTAGLAGLGGWLGRRRGRFRRLPFAAAWTGARDLPAPEGATFIGQWRRRGQGP